MQPELDSKTGLPMQTALGRNAGRDLRGRLISLLMFLCAAFCIVVTVSIVFILVQSSIKFFTNELFTNIGYLQQTTRELGREAGISTVDMQEALSKAVDLRERTIERITDLMPGITPEQFMSTFEGKLEAASDFGKWWTTITTSFQRFFLDNRWTPLFASKRFGIWPLVNGTLIVTFVAMMVATPLGLATAVYLGMYAPKRLAAVLRPAVELLAGIPTVVYGYFALIYITPVIQKVIPETAVFKRF